MLGKRKLNQIENDDWNNSNDSESEIETIPKKRATKRSKLQDIDEYKIDSKIAQESIRKKIIKQTKKSSNVQFSNPKLKKRSTSMQSSRKKRISVNTNNTFDLVNFEEFHTDSESSKMRIWHHLRCFLIIIMKFNESGDDNWLFRIISRYYLHSKLPWFNKKYCSTAYKW